jgi:enterochelin esterase-like enzyme
MNRRFAALLLTLLVCAPGLAAQPYAAGPQVVTFRSDVDVTDQPYALYLPPRLEAGKKYPLVISLHGAMSNHRLNLRRVFGRGNRPGETDAEATRYFPPFRDVDFIVASPLSRGTMGYQGIPEKDVYDVIADVRRRFPIDEDRVYLTGLSMGGGGTLWLGLTRPDLWAAIAPVCPAVRRETEDLAPNALNVPVHLFHGDQDNSVPVEVSRRWQKLLLRLGGPVEYREYPGVRHNSWDDAYRDGAIFDWFGQFRRTRFPDRVRFVTRAYKYRTAYWVRVDGLTPGELATIDARFTGPNRIEVETTGLDGFTLHLDGHSKFSAGNALQVVVDGTVHKISVRKPLSFARAPDRRGKGPAWKAALYTPGTNSKRPGLEGPIRDAVSGRHIYVYGTRNAGEEELRSRRAQAEQAADWSSLRLRLLLSLRVASDRDLDSADRDGANLVLFGNRETNALIARLAGSFPIELNPGAADYGLIFVAPAGDRYVVVNSGLPWWIGAEAAARQVMRFMSPVYSALLNFGDYVLFKGSLANVVAEGRFDRNWKVPPSDAAKMLSTGAVQIR